MRQSLRPYLLGTIYCALHISVDALSNGVLVSQGVAIRYSPGLALAILALGGMSYFPLVLVTCVVSDLLFPVANASLWIQIIVPAIIAAVYAATAWCVRRQFGPAPLARTPRETIYLMAAGLGAPALVSILTTILQLAAGQLAADRAGTAMLYRWMSHSASILTLVPVAAVFIAPWLLAGHPRAPRRQGRSRAETVAQLFALLACLWFAYWLPEVRRYHLSVVCFAPLIWIALTRGIRGATLATLAINIGGFLSLRLVHASRMECVDFLVFSLVAAAVGMGLGTVVNMRDEDHSLLEQSEARLSQALASARLGLWDSDLVAGTVTYDRNWTEMLGYSLDDARHEFGWWDTLVHPDDLQRVKDLIRAHLEGRSPFYECDYRMRTRSGSWKWVHARGSVVARGADGTPLRFTGTHLDLSERRESEKERNRLLHIIEASPDYIGSADLDGRLLHINPAFRRLIGIDRFQPVGARHFSEFHPEWAAAKIVQEGIPHAISHGLWVGETALRDRHGREFPVSQLIILQRDDEGRPALLSTIARDISKIREIEAARLATERKMLQAQKLESLGVLAGGIAHDFNNLLTVMLGNASLAELDLPPGSSVIAYLDQIKVSAIRAAELCKQMLAYSGRGQFAPAPLDLSELVGDMTQLLQVSIAKKSSLHFDLTRGLPPVNVDAAQIRQIVMNLVVNASDAIGDRGGTIRVATGIASVAKEEFAEIEQDLDLPGGEYVFLEVTDDGCGMKPEIKARIFEPFFTTKFAGRGLGLAAVLGIVRGHRGALKVHSEPGQGSNFRLLLPAEQGALPATPLASPLLDARASEPGKILVVDDEETVRVVAARILETRGYRTVLASDGPHAIEIFQHDPKSFLAILLDLTMPKMSGEQAMRELRKIRHDVPVILMSGFSAEDTVDRFSGTDLAGFLSKPFDRETLIRCVQTVHTNSAQRN